MSVGRYEQAIDAQLDVLEQLVVQEAAVFAASVRAVAELMRLARAEDGVAGLDSVLMDIAGTCALGQGAAGTRMGQALRLTGDLTGILAGLETGSVLVGQARVVLAETESCSDVVAAEVERRLLAVPPAGVEGMSPADVRRRVKALVLQVQAELEPERAAEQADRARSKRRVVVRPEPDGMAGSWALLPAEQARVFTLGLDELARRQRITDRQDGVERTADQRRADLLAMLPALALHALDGTSPHAALSAGGVSLSGRVTGEHGLLTPSTPSIPSTPTTPGSGGGCGPVLPDKGLTGSDVVPAAEVGTGVPAGCWVGHPAVQLVVHTPMATVLGVSEQPGELDGYGPISARQVRLLLPDARLRRLLVDADSGRPIAADTRTHRPAGSQSAARRVLAGMLAGEQPVAVVDEAEPQYRPSAGLDRFVRLRDRRCSGPGCAQPAGHGDLDHLEPWPAGPTSAGNLSAASRRCHRAKTVSGWTVVAHDDGQVSWTSPRGGRYTRPPAWAAPPSVSPHARLGPLPADRPPDHPPEHSQDDLGAHPEDDGLTPHLEPAPDSARAPAHEDPDRPGYCRGWPDDIQF